MCLKCNLFISGSEGFVKNNAIHLSKCSASRPLKFYLTQHTTPIAKSRVPLTRIWYWQVIQLNQENTIPSTPRHHRNTDKTPQKHRQSMSKTPKTSPNTVKTLRKHHQSATKKPIETQLRDHQDTSRTDTTNSRKDLHRVFPKKLLPAYFGSYMDNMWIIYG